MRLFLSWYLLLPAVLAVFYGYMQYRAVAAMGAPVRPARFNGLASGLSGAALTVGWSAAGVPLPVFYVLAYLLRAMRLVGRKQIGRRDWFLLNLGYINSMALHLAVIGTVALARGVTMHTLLGFGFWRTMSTVAVFALDLIETWAFLRRPSLPAVLSFEAESEEARPFIAFLWFCTGYLLVDSFMCMAELEPLYPPLFLIGSIAIMMYFVIRFLLHIRTIIRDEYLENEHDHLAAQLEAIRQSTGTLKRIVNLDTMTGAFSRRNILERMDELIRADQPFSIAFLDLDGLKQINDSEGHDAGDRYLIGFAQAMKARLWKGGMLARVGGDEFVVLMPGCGGRAAARGMESIRCALEARSRGESIFRFSYGISEFCPGKGGSAEALMQSADQAMYQDKERRR